MTRKKTPKPKVRTRKPRVRNAEPPSIEDIMDGGEESWMIGNPTKEPPAKAKHDNKH